MIVYCDYNEKCPNGVCDKTNKEICAKCQYNKEIYHNFAICNLKNTNTFTDKEIKKYVNMKKNKDVKQYKEGDRLYVYMDSKTKATIVKIVDAEAIMVIYKYWNKYKQMWIYDGKKFTEVLFWNSLVLGLSPEERNKLFELNGFNYEEVKGY